jgi:hypothetical protein
LVRVHSAIVVIASFGAFAALPLAAIEHGASYHNVSSNPRPHASANFDDIRTLQLRSPRYVVNGQEKLLLQKVWCGMPDDATPSAGPSPASASPAPSSAHQAAAPKLCGWRALLVGDGEKSLVLFAPSHRLPDDSGTAAAAAADAGCTCACATPRNDILPLRLQCRLLELGKRMAGWEKTVLLPNRP